MPTTLNKKHAIFRKRLLKLADFLDKLPPEKFNYRHWVGDDWEGKPDLSCGTTACALGWATAIPSLRKAGLYLKRIERSNRYTTSGVVVVCCAGSRPGEDAAGKKVFGLTQAETHFLFIPGSYNPYDICMERGPSDRATASDVAGHIRKFVKHKYGHAA